MEPLSILFKPPFLVAFPPRLCEKLQRPLGIIGNGLDAVIVIIGLFCKGAGDSFSLTVEDILYDLIHINGHAQSQAHARVIKGFTPHIIPNVGVAQRESGEMLIRWIVFQPLYLMGLHVIAVHGARIKFHLLR